MGVQTDDGSIITNALRYAFLLGNDMVTSKTDTVTLLTNTLRCAKATLSSVLNFLFSVAIIEEPTEIV